MDLRISYRCRFWFCLFLSVFLLAACGSSKKYRSKHGYYEDDGPSSAPPNKFSNMPDAVPRVEPYIRGALKPYRVNGKTYTPITHNRPFKQRGIGSWYGKKFHGRKTASGEIYDMNKMTAAHPTLPLPSYARVTHVKSGRQVIVRINDRGPFLRNRIIDLSYAAASKLNYASKGSDLLEVERLLPEDIKRGIKKSEPHKTFVKIQEKEPVKTTQKIPQKAIVNAPTYDDENDFIFDPASSPSVALPLDAAVKEEYYLQLGVFSKKENAEEARKFFEESFSYAVKLEEENGVFRVLSGPFPAHEDAASIKKEIINGSDMKPVIIIH